MRFLAFRWVRIHVFSLRAVTNALAAYPGKPRHLVAAWLRPGAGNGPPVGGPFPFPRRARRP